MADNIGSLFKDVESQRRQHINLLMKDWKSEIARNYSHTYWEQEDPLSYFISDGFLPGYYNQTNKVLFIGREPRYMDKEGDWVQYMINRYKNGANHNQKAFTRKLLSIIQGIKSNGTLKFENLKKANDYAEEIVSKNDYGFAFMNMSKYSNEVKPDSDYDLINQFLEDSNLGNRNYFREELEILSPDVIITLHLWNGGIAQKHLDLCFGKIEWEKISNAIDGKVNTSKIILNNKSIKLVNTYHLASTYSNKEYFYDPIMEILFK